MENKEIPEWEKDFKKVKFNIIYFLEKFYNVAYPDKAVELTDEEKQKYFNKYRGIPLIKDFDQLKEWEEKEKELKDKGYKDWEIF